jgi:hypothetical protein
MRCERKIKRSHSPYSQDAQNIKSECNEISFINNGTCKAFISIGDSIGVLKTLEPEEILTLGSDHPDQIETDNFNIKFEEVAGSVKEVQVMRTFIQ